MESNYLLILTFSTLLAPAATSLIYGKTEQTEGGREGEIRKNRAINKGTDEKRKVNTRRRRMHVSSSC